MSSAERIRPLWTPERIEDRDGDRGAGRGEGRGEACGVVWGIDGSWTPVCSDIFESPTNTDCLFTFALLPPSSMLPLFENSSLLGDINSSKPPVGIEVSMP